MIVPISLPCPTAHWTEEHQHKFGLVCSHFANDFLDHSELSLFIQATSDPEHSHCFVINIFYSITWIRERILINIFEYRNIICVNFLVYWKDENLLHFTLLCWNDRGTKMCDIHFVILIPINWVNERLVWMSLHMIRVRRSEIRIKCTGLFKFLKWSKRWSDDQIWSNLTWWLCGRTRFLHAPQMINVTCSLVGTKTVALHENPHLIQWYSKVIRRLCVIFIRKNYIQMLY